MADRIPAPAMDPQTLHGPSGVEGRSDYDGNDQIFLVTCDELEVAN